MNGERHIILFDGVCNLCNSTVQSIIKKDRKNIFKFAALQSASGKDLLKRFALTEDHFQSFVYIKNDQYFLRSDAALEVAKSLGGIWRSAYIFKVVPKNILDACYNFIAKHRYKWFGKKDECMVPTPQLKERFL